MDDAWLYTEISKGLWRASLFYHRKTYPYSGPGHWTNRELTLKLAQSAAEAASLARSAVSASVEQT